MPVVEYQIPREFFARIIGQRGSTIKALQQNCDVNIRLADEGNSVRVTGDDGAIAKAAAELEDLLGFRPTTEALATAQFDIDKKHYGKIIGSHGSTLKELQEKTHCSISVPRRGSDEEYITVEGPDSGIEQLMEAMKDLVPSFKVIGKTVQAIIRPETIDLDSCGEINEALFFPEPEDENDRFDRFLKYLRSAKRTLEICVFTITDNRISDAILDAHQAGIKVRVISDDDCATQQGSDISKFVDAGIPLALDNSPSHMHHKFGIVDGHVLINGSFNWTRGAAEQNCENIVITTAKPLVASFAAEFERLWRKFA